MAFLASGTCMGSAYLFESHFAHFLSFFLFILLFSHFCWFFGRSNYIYIPKLRIGNILHLTRLHIDASHFSLFVFSFRSYLFLSTSSTIYTYFFNYPCFPHNFSTSPYSFLFFYLAGFLPFSTLSARSVVRVVCPVGSVVPLNKVLCLNYGLQIDWFRQSFELYFRP